jgi:hypothetical protein
VRKAIAVAALSTFAVAAYATIALSAPKPAPALTGPITKLQYLIGTWSCTTNVAASPTMAASTHQGTMMFSVEPSNTVGFYLQSDIYSTGGYIGWVDAKKMWWSSSADNFGGVVSEAGPDSAGAGSTLTGTTLYQGQTIGSRDTITKISDTKYHDLYEIQNGGAWSMGAESTCTKTSDKSM